tara:strand:+ start:1220 stop:1573 length:354 start_codon:yes stop_codon:yes gene_type:complete
MIRIFVYGTLRKGDERSFFLTDVEQAKFIKEAKTKPLYTLVNLGMFPALIMEGNTSIVGEVWEVDKRTKQTLDLIEGVPLLYQDEEIYLDDDTSAIAYVFQYNRGYPEIESGDWFNK